MEDLKSQLSQSLFWDVDMNDLNIEKHAPQIIEKVLSRGDIADWKLIKDYYGWNRIADEVVKLRYLDDRTLNFASHLFSVPKQNFRCYIMKQSHPGPWKY